MWNIEQRGAFVMSSLYDGKRFYWFGTEDNGPVRKTNARFFRFSRKTPFPCLFSGNCLRTQEKSAHTGVLLLSLGPSVFYNSRLMNSSAPAPALILFFDHTALMGGGEVSLLNLVTHLDRKRFEPVVVLAQDGELRDKLAQIGVEVHVLPLASEVGEVRKDSLVGARSVSLSQVKHMARYIWQLSGFMRARGADLVHANSLKADILGALAARLAGVPVIWHVRDRIANDYLPRPATRGFRLACRFLPSFLVVNSLATLETLHLPPSKRARVVYNGVVHDGLPPAQFEQARREQILARGERRTTAPIIALVGRISPWKGQDVFLKAAAQVVDEFPGTRFQIIGAPLFGEQDYEREVRALCTSLGLDQNVEWLGFRRDVPQLVAGCDLLVHASKTGEPFGQVVVEAMMASRPVVATRGGGIPEIVLEGETGLLVPMNDAGAMARAMETMLRDPERAEEMGKNGALRARSKFTIQRTASKIEAVYDFILARQRQRETRRQGALLALGAFSLGVGVAQRRERRAKK